VYSKKGIRGFFVALTGIKKGIRGLGDLKD